METIKADEMKRLRMLHARYESGQIKKASPSVLIGYSKLFDVPINTLYENAQTEWVSALEEAGLRDPRVAGFIEYLEEQAQKESEGISLSSEEYDIIAAYRSADSHTRKLVMYALGVPCGEDVDIVKSKKED